MHLQRLREVVQIRVAEHALVLEFAYFDRSVANPIEIPVAIIDDFSPVVAVVARRLGLGLRHARLAGDAIGTSQVCSLPGADGQARDRRLPELAGWKRLRREAQRTDWQALPYFMMSMISSRSSA